MKKLRVFQIAIPLVLLLMTISLLILGLPMMNTQTTLEYEPYKPFIMVVDEQDFHEDFDSTYYWNGCRTDTFKLNHKCK